MFNYILLIGMILMACTVLMVHQDARRFRNSIVLTFAIFFLLLGLVVELKTESAVAAMFIFFIGAVLLYLLLIIVLVLDTIVLIKREGFRLANILPFMFACAMCAFVGQTLIGFNESVVGQPASVILTSLFIITFIFAFIFGCFFVYSITYQLLPKRVKCDYIIIHGAGLVKDKVSPLLAKRVDKAIRVYERGEKQAKLIASGGQGNDEEVSEAQAISNYLIEKGIDKQDIILEDQSTTTYENLLFSKKIIDETGKDDYYCYYVTNNYHVFRTSLFAKQVGLKGAGVGCHTALYYWPTAFIREYIAICNHYKIIIGIVIVITLLIFNI